MKLYHLLVFLLCLPHYLQNINFHLYKTNSQIVIITSAYETMQLINSCWLEAATTALKVPCSFYKLLHLFICIIHLYYNNALRPQVSRCLLLYKPIALEIWSLVQIIYIAFSKNKTGIAQHLSARVGNRLQTSQLLVQYLFQSSSPILFPARGTLGFLKCFACRGRQGRLPGAGLPGSLAGMLALDLQPSPDTLPQVSTIFRLTITLPVDNRQILSIHSDWK